LGFIFGELLGGLELLLESIGHFDEVFLGLLLVLLLHQDLLVQKTHLVE
jgi:hypothetical protein